jgi:Tfp pilus assembly pilus retraction ATPase PilT
MLAGSLIGVMRQELVPHKDGTGYSMVHDTLLGTEFVRNTIEKGDWAALEKATGRDVPNGPNFVPMRQGVNALVSSRAIELEMAAAVLRQGQ